MTSTEKKIIVLFSIVVIVLITCLAALLFIIRQGPHPAPVFADGQIQEVREAYEEKDTGDTPPETVKTVQTVESDAEAGTQELVEASVQELTEAKEQELVESCGQAEAYEEVPGLDNVVTGGAIVSLSTINDYISTRDKYCLYAIRKGGKDEFLIVTDTRSSEFGKAHTSADMKNDIEGIPDSSTMFLKENEFMMDWNDDELVVFTNADLDRSFQVTYGYVNMLPMVIRHPSEDSSMSILYTNNAEHVRGYAKNVYDRCVLTESIPMSSIAKESFSFLQLTDVKINGTPIFELEDRFMAGEGFGNDTERKNWMLIMEDGQPVDVQFYCGSVCYNATMTPAICVGTGEDEYITDAGYDLTDRGYAVCRLQERIESLWGGKGYALEEFGAPDPTEWANERCRIRISDCLLGFTG